MPPRNVDERTATSIRVPGSGASTEPTTTKPADVSNPPDQRSAENNRPVTRTADVRPNKTIETVPADFDFEVRHTTPRSASAEASSTENPPGETTQGPAGEAGVRPNAEPQTMRIKFRGEDREYPLETIKTLAQQGLNVAGDSPVLGVINEIKKQTGITDPKKLAELVMMAVQKVAGGAGAPRINMAERAVENANVAAAAAAPALELPPPNPEAESVVLEFEQANGLQLPEAMRAAILNIVKHGQSLDTIVNTYGAMFKQVQGFSADLQRRSTMALSSAVNAEAARVAQELGIDTQEEVQAFAKFVGDYDQDFPGFKARIMKDPKAMGKAVRTFYEISIGRRTNAERAAHTDKVNTDLVRAGGDMSASPRPGGGLPSSQPSTDDSNFEKDLMAKM